MKTHQQITRKTKPKPPALIVTAQPFGKSGRWWSIICPYCRKLHTHGDVPPDIYSKREAPCNSAGSYWIKQRR